MEETPIILKEHVQGSIKISKLIIEKGLEGKKLSQVEDAEKNRDIYYEFISPALKQYKSKYNNMSPNMILNEFLKIYKVKNNLDNYLSKGLKFYGQKLVSYEWACIYKGDPLVKKRHYSFSPQLFILINKMGIKFGFCYGTEVNNDDDCVDIVRESEEIKKNLVPVLKNNENLKFNSYSLAEDPPHQDNIVIINNSEDLEINWNEKTHILSYYSENLIPDNISDKIEKTFDALLDIFKKSSLLEIQESVEHQCIAILKQASNEQPKINYKKILEITRLLIEKLKMKNIKKNPTVIVFSAGILWHNVFNRPNNSEYLMQEDLNRIFEGGLGAVRYLRNELGINERKYGSMEDFIMDLEKLSSPGDPLNKNIKEMRVWDIVTNKIIGRDKINQSAVEAVVFLYFDNSKSYTKNEIWEAVKSFINLEGDTPFNTFNSDLSRYTDNSEVAFSNRRSPLMFTITNFGEKTHKLQLIDSIRKRIEDYEKKTPYVWQMIKKAAENLGEQFSNTDIKNYILEKYGDININTIDTQIIVCTVNHDSRIHNQENKKPRIANSKYDFLYRIEKGKGELELYDPGKHGIWEIREHESGKLKVARKIQVIYDFINFKREYLSSLMKNDTNIKNSNKITEIVDQILKLLEKRKQIILIGPPGTGKTHIAKIIASQITNGNAENVNLIQFHPEYCYENFIECLQIKTGSNMELELKTQIFRQICEEAFDSKLKILYENHLNDQVKLPENERSEFKDWYEKMVKNDPDFLSKKVPKYVLIIDEINRGDLSRIFGEAIMALEYRNTPIKTMYSDDEHPLVIPDNLYVIGTMNSVDRSIAILDYALRRRFLFYEVKPNREVLEEWLDDNESEIKDEILDIFDRLNDEKSGWITETWKDSPHLAINFQIGHTYFFHKTNEEFQIEWENSIVPLLLEYMNFSNELKESFQEKFDLRDPFI